MFRFRLIALNLIYFFNVLLIFLLLFEDKVELPIFLQVTGRMHPLILHFPLVLLFVGIFFEFLITRKDYQQQAVAKITTYVFYLFALSAALAALFGFFLYKEGSYLGDEMILHKWMGTAVSLLAVILVWLKERSTVSLYYGVLAISSVCLVVAGHVGSEVTHGEGFLTEPLQKRQNIIEIENADSAVVFRDVIQPIFNEKCLNCHNVNRAKNNLILTDYQNLIKGGENGEALVGGKAEESLLYKYIMLPMNDSLHMPPKEKLQLDREEIKLIGWWINTGAVAHQKYASLPKVDSIESIMLSKFQPKTGVDLLDIPFADHEEIEQLNTPYRTVQQISATKPYIAVFLGSKKDFTAKDLTDLKAVGDQVVSIDLGNSLVKDEDLKTLKQFPHVQKLHLQNIDIGDQGVQHLKDLRFLDVLNLSGTKISAKALEEVSGWQNLKKLYVYNTPLSEESVASIKKSRPELEVYNTQFDLTDSVYTAQLTTPVVKIDSSFFREHATVEIKLSRGKVKYYYTLDGTEPTPNANQYGGPFKVNQTTEIKIKATMDGWMDSKVAALPLLKLGIKPDRVRLETKPHPKHSGKLDSTLVDGKAAGLDRGEKEYLGFIKQDCKVFFEFDNPQKITQLTLSLLEDIGQGVLMPEHVEVWGGEDKNNLKKLGSAVNALPQELKPATKCILKIDFSPQTVRFVRLTAKKAKALPAWHPDKKTTEVSIFVDEVSLE